MWMELSVQEQKYQAVLAVLSDGRSVSEVAEHWSVSRQSVHAWLRRYEDSGLAGLESRSIRMQYQPATRDYVAHRAAEGKTSREIKRRLTRYVARDFYRLLESGAADA